ncbi:hypothetical protein pEpSNUABM08_34 [Erwinia phage pEp_SNUABM_08]|uniref:Uncharacterized protein n=1 Tax=Erwinia phage pEp_SNUABM_08 TaxID=2593268 RepID=A0A5J6DAM7_9CAUD|nr:hypothetical protein JT353_gp34 [Erwinia phage pEp_SNUABM_08]QEQ94781.1 hypothetical protein pEpSNUABM08_34 [Erwinia phage pEp_SNUABM_08]
MAVLFAEGFSGVQRASGATLTATPLTKLGYIGKAFNNNTSDVTNNTSWTAQIAADPVFADRNRLAIASSNNTYQWEAQLRMPLDTRGFEKFVIGFTAETFSATAVASTFTQIMLTGNTQITNSNSLPSDLIVGVSVNNDGVSAGTVFHNTADGSTPLPSVLKAKLMHIEALIEQDVDRIRVYVDGVLVQDYTYTGTFASADGGFGLVARYPVGQANSSTGVWFSNVYMLGLDAIHTGVLGPATRILEVAPQTDKAVEWKHPDAYASNAAVLQQYFDAANPAYLTTGGPATDLYGGLDAVGQNAAAVHGAVFKMQAMTMAEGEHTLASAVEYNGTKAIGAKEYPLILATLNNFVMDVSKNPVTNAKWTPQEIANAGFGFSLIK